MLLEEEESVAVIRGALLGMRRNVREYSRGWGGGGEGRREDGGKGDVGTAFV